MGSANSPLMAIRVQFVLALVVSLLIQGSIAQESCGRQAGGATCSGGNCCSQYGYCGTTSEYCGDGCQSGCSTGGSTPSSSCGSGVPGIVSSTLFNQVFPNRNPFYTYNDFITAANAYPGFGTAGDCTTRKREIAAFFAHNTQETSGLLYINEINPPRGYYCRTTTLAQYPCASGKEYFGRGPKQLSWNYNYKQFGDSISRDLVNNPELLATDAVISFKSAIWFWMTAQTPKPSCHNVMTGRWTPSSTDRANGRTATFGMTTVIINGGVECGSGASNPGGNTNRMNYYSSIGGTLGVSTGSGTSCASMTPYSD